MTEFQFRLYLGRIIDTKYGSIRAFAKANSIHESHVRRLLSGERKPGPKLLERLGLVRVISYQEASG